MKKFIYKIRNNSFCCTWMLFDKSELLLRIDHNFSFGHFVEGPEHERLPAQRKFRHLQPGIRVHCKPLMMVECVRLWKSFAFNFFSHFSIGERCPIIHAPLGRGCGQSTEKRHGLKASNTTRAVREVKAGENRMMHLYTRYGIYTSLALSYGSPKLEKDASITVAQFIRTFHWRAF